MCRRCLAHYLAELLLRRQRSPVSVSEALAREFGDEQGEVVMLMINTLISRAHKRNRRPVVTLGFARVCDCTLGDPHES